MVFVDCESGLWYNLVNKMKIVGVVMLLEATNLSKSFGENLLFKSGGLKVEAGDRIGLIGANGCGKTTLFNIISGNEDADGGGVVRAGGVTVGTLSQHACKGSEKSCYEEALSVFSALLKTEAELDELHRFLETSEDVALIERAERLRDEFHNRGGLTFRSMTRAALIGLGFSEEELSLSVHKMSGGQRSKIEICKLLLSSPDVMLLDEPTNHLDIDAIEWLDGFIKQSKSAFIIISHDRYFLDRVANKIISIEHKKINCYNGNYTKYLVLKEHREETVRREFDNTMCEVHRIEGIIEQQRRWNRERNIRTAESKQKQIDRLLEGLEIPENEIEQMTLSFTATNRCSEEVLSVYDAECRFGEKTLYSGVSLNVRRGEHILIIGSNGCGKTTLLKSVRDGLGKRGVGVTVGYFDQHAEALDDKNTVFSQLRSDLPNKTDTEIRCALALFMFKGDEVFKEISSLSGGEKARVALCSLMLKCDNLLLLDEPTNHLDLTSREILEAALEDYDGTIVAVSHDRYFINRIADRIVYFENGRVRELTGNYDDYLIFRDSCNEKSEKIVKTVGAGGASYKQKKEEAARQRRLKTQIEKTEQEIALFESRQSEIEQMLCNPDNATDYERISALSLELEEIKQKISSLFEVWEELSEII